MNIKLFLFLTSFLLLFTTDYILAQPTINTKEAVRVSNSYKDFRITYPRIEHTKPYLRNAFSQPGRDNFVQNDELISYSTLYRKGYCMGFTQVYDKESVPEGVPRGYTTYALNGNRYHILTYKGFQIFNSREEVCQKLAEIIAERNTTN